MIFFFSVHFFEGKKTQTATSEMSNLRNENYNFVELNSVESWMRKKWILLIAELANKRGIENPLIFSRILENTVYLERQSKIEIGQGIFICRYGDSDILDLDFRHAHETAASLRYTNLLRRIAWALDSGNCVSLSDPSSWLTASDELLVEGTAHSIWERSFYAKKELARDVLSGKSGGASASSPSVGIFACPRCKSFDVDSEQKQTRSSDEPMTIFCTCNMCEKRFVR